MAFQLGVGVFARVLGTAPAKSMAMAIPVHEGSGASADDSHANLQAVLATLSLRHHFGAGFAVDLSLPTGLVRYDPGPGIPAGYVTGLGDIRLGARYDFAGVWGARGYRPRLIAQAFLLMPTGTQATLTSANAAFAPSVLSVGRGAFGVGGRLSLAQRLFGTTSLVADVSVDAPLSRNSNGVRIGAAFEAGLGAMHVFARRLALVGRVSYRYRARANKQGEGALLQSGGDWLSGELVASLRIGKRWTVGVSGRVPFFIDTNGRQIVESFTGVGFVSVSFGGGAKAGGGGGHGHGHGHGHAHGGGIGHRHQHGREGKHGHGHGRGRADVADAATGGTNVTLAKAAVAGKLTVVDFWASWCKPCLEIGRRLRALAARHAKTLAVRRVEVPTLDSAAGRAHRVRRLPLVVLLDKHGQVLQRLEGTKPQAVIDAVKGALKRAGGGGPKATSQPASRPTSQPASRPAS